MIDYSVIPTPPDPVCEVCLRLPRDQRTGRSNLLEHCPRTSGPDVAYALACMTAGVVARDVQIAQLRERMVAAYEAKEALRV